MSVEAMRQALLEKRAAETTSVETNVDQSNSEKNNVYPDPADRGPGTLSATGEKPHPDLFHHSTDVWQAYLASRPQMLGRLFNEMPAASAADKALISKNFNHGGTAQHEAHSPLLQKKASHASPPTLAERVRRLISR